MVQWKGVPLLHLLRVEFFDLPFIYTRSGHRLGTVSTQLGALIGGVVLLQRAGNLVDRIEPLLRHLSNTVHRLRIDSGHAWGLGTGKIR